MSKKVKAKKPINKDKLITWLSVIATIIIIVVATFLSAKEVFGKTSVDISGVTSALEKLNEPYNITAFITNEITEEDFESLKVKCSAENANWDLFTNGAFDAEKYTNLNSVGGGLELTDSECGRLLQGLLVLTDSNTCDVHFDEVSISLYGQDVVDFKFVFSFSLTSVLSISTDVNSELSDSGINLPQYVYAINSASYNLTTGEISDVNIRYNSLTTEESKNITALLNAGKQGNDKSFETFATRLLIAMNSELTSKTQTTAQFTEGGVTYIKD